MNGENQSKSDIKRMRQQKAGRRKRIKRIVIGVGLTAFAVLLIALAVFRSKQNSEGVPGEVYLDAGQEHIGLVENPPRPYASNPPSSGAHFASPAKSGVYDYEINDKIVIHNLEHGEIWIAYHPRIPKGVLEDLRRFTEEHSGAKIVMAPRSLNDSDVALVAWRHVYKFNVSGDALSEEEKNNIRAFYRARVNRGPEFVPAGMGGGIDPKSVPGGMLQSL